MLIRSDQSFELSMLRHGITEAGRCYIGSTDATLTDQGWAQMADACVPLNNDSDDCYWDVVVSSPLSRCLDFAKKFSEVEKIPCDIESDFRELHFGIMEGLTALEVMDKYPNILESFWQNPLLNAPAQSEGLAEFHARVVACLHRIQHQYRGKRVLLVAHGGVIRSLLCHLEHKPIEKLLEIEVSHGELITKCI